MFKLQYIDRPKGRQYPVWQDDGNLPYDTGAPIQQAGKFYVREREARLDHPRHYKPARAPDPNLIGLELYKQVHDPSAVFHRPRCEKFFEPSVILPTVQDLTHYQKPYHMAGAFMTFN